MNFKRSFALIPLLSMSLLAEAPKFGLEGQVSLVAATGDLNKMVDTGNLTGYNGGLAFRIETKPGFGFRLYANLMSIRGIDGSGLESPKPKHLNAGVDLTQEYGKLTFFGGMGIMKWKQDDATTTLASFADVPLTVPATLNAQNKGKGTKFAGRIGMEYAITPKLHGVISYTHTEFNKVFQPSWLSFGVSYRFASF